MPGSTAGYKRFFAELKRRHVFRVAAIYGAVAFAVLQVADPLATALGLPDSFLSLVLALLMLGFPVALVLAWAFEVTPEGVQKTESAAPGEIEAIVAQPASKRWPAGLLALGGIVLLFGGGWWMGQRTGSGSALNLGVPEAGAAEFDVVAVLPFENVGGEADDDVLASGLEYDLQQNLGRLTTLRAIAPGSVREYRSTEKADGEIGDELGADYILRGRVLRAGSRVRVNVQLIDAETSENLWGDQFDRDVTPDNLLVVQSEIAAEVARRLAIRMSPEDVADLPDVADEPPSASMAALAAYNRARQVYNTPAPGETWFDALAHAERAVELDSTFVEAWSFVARLSALVSQGDTTHVGRAREAMLRTERLAPGSVEATTARAFHTYYVEREFEAAREQLRRARELAPSDLDIVSGLAYLNRRLGRWDESIDAFKEAIALDPRSPHLYTEYATTLARLGRMAAADDVAERALQVGPASPGARIAKVGSTIERYGDIGRARSLADELGLDSGDRVEAAALTWLATLDRDFDTAMRLVDAVPPGENPFDEYVRLGGRAWILALSGGDPTAVSDSMSAAVPSARSGLAQLMAGYGAALAGEEERASRLFDEAVRQVEAEGDVWTAAEYRSNVAATRALTGAPDAALTDLEDLVDLPGAELSLHAMRLDPVFDRLRDDPRFDELLERRRAFEERAAREAELDRPWLP